MMGFAALYPSYVLRASCHRVQGQAKDGNVDRSDTTKQILDEETARRVGARHGKPHIFKVDALAMHASGLKFYLADNGVWLTDQVLPEFLVTSSTAAD